MIHIPDPPCGNDTFLEMLRLSADELSSDFSEIFQDAGLMAETAARIRRRTGASFCILPFCHTLEAESYGADIRPGNRFSSPRPGSYRFSRMEELDGLFPSDLSTQRIQEALTACRLLSERGEAVLFQFSGPFTILDSLLPSHILFHSMRKHPDRMMDIFQRIGRDSLVFMDLVQKAGARIISYADPMGAPGILGPGLSRSIAEQFTLELLNHADHMLDRELLILLCPKTALSLTNADLAYWKEHPLSAPLSYGEAAMRMRGKVRFGGKACPRLSDSVKVFHELIINKK